MTLANIRSFKSDNRIFLRNELKSWATLLIIIAALYAINRYLIHFTEVSIVVIGFFALLFKTRDTLIYFRVAEINIDPEKDLIMFHLRSAMSGDKTKSYQLSSTVSVFEQHTGLKRLLWPAFVLKLQVKPKETFAITNRYGFSFQTLNEVDKVVKSLTEKTFSFR